MKREIAYTEQQLTESFLLNMQRNAMIAMSKMIESLFNSTTVVHGLTCTPTAPASLQVQISAGEIYQSAPLDATDYGVLPADTSHNIMKQGILLDAVVRNCPAPTTNGFAINYLIQAGFQENDGDPQTLNFYNSANPASPLQSSLNTERDGQCVVTAKAGIAAAVGTQTTPAADAGFVGLWVVTVTYGQTTIIAGNIVQATNAPFIGSVASNLLASNAALLEGYPASHFLSSTDVATNSSRLGGALPGAYIQHSLATAANDFLVASGAGAFVKKTLIESRTILLPSGTLIQHRYTPLTTKQAVTSTIPYDDTIPQNTEGAQILTDTITPQFAGSRIRISARVQGVAESPGAALGAIFQDSIANAIASQYASAAVGGGYATHSLYIVAEITAPTTTPISFYVRVGTPSGSRYTVNGELDARKLGGTWISDLTIEEFKQ